MLIFVSGVHSGPNPGPGIGIARAIRSGYPNVRLIGVDYSNRSSGLSWPDFDDVVVYESWTQLDLDRHADRLREHLSAGALWFSGLDLEVWWLARTVKPAIGALVPPLEALVQSNKPAVAAAGLLGISVPPSIPITEDPVDVHSFCRRRGWRVWVKGPWYDAIRVSSWPQVLDVSEQMKSTWSTQQIFLQEHIDGNEEAVAFAGFQGELLGCVHMTKTAVTGQGKTWSGKVSPTEPGLYRGLAEFVRITQWTGGGELEMVRDSQGKPWIIEINPRFPAWIYGGVIGGINLPASLIFRLTGIMPHSQPPLHDQFTRVVVELPNRVPL